MWICSYILPNLGTCSGTRPTMNLLLLLSALGVVYSYAFYPLILRLFREGEPFVPSTPAAWPKASIIVTAHNEEHRIREKLENALAIDYPADQIEIIVASDCSTDQTDAIVESFGGNIRLVRADQHLGKEYAQLCAIREARGEILIFSDVATQIPTDAIQKMVSYFSDPRVGAVSSEDRFISDDGKVAGEGAYVKYEMWLRALESRRAGLVGLSGSFFACRKEICEGWDTQSPSDFNTALRTARAGLSAISCPDVLGYYKDIKDPNKEYQRKVRTVIRGITSISRHPDVLDIGEHGLFSFQVWSHKIMRWAVPWFMLLTSLFTLIGLGHSPLANLFALGQVIFYGIAFVGWKIPSARDHTLVRLIFFFVQVNLSIADACIQFARGKRMTVWTPSKR
ncbi:Glycosyl transferase, group 2 [gamma proteobacterium HdN1]|nr:Glycosyl transferase, group 2 [gamma proteobacterium HdN1]